MGVTGRSFAESEFLDLLLQGENVIDITAYPFFGEEGEALWHLRGFPAVALQLLREALLPKDFGKSVLSVSG